MKPLIDLTIPIRNGMTTYPSDCHQRVEITQLGRIHQEGRETRRIVMGTHTGTHMDAPRHFIKNGKTIDQIDPTLFVGDCSVFRRVYWDRNRQSGFSFDEIDRRLKSERPRRVLLDSQWSQRADTTDYYSNPPLDNGLAQILIGAGVELLAMDTPSPDSETTSPRIHNLLLGAGMFLVESLINVELLRTMNEIELFCFPIKIENGDGAPCRVLARPL